MKKKYILLTMMLGGATVFAQDLTSKKGETMLPEAGDWAVQFDAAPLFQYAGSIFSGDSLFAPGATWVNTGTIAGKYFKDASTAYRVKLNIGMGSVTSKGLVRDEAAFFADPTSTDMVEDTRKDGFTNITIGAGMEMRRGKGRLQGFYGAELMFMMGSTKTTYSYGNEYDPQGNTHGITSYTNGADGMTVNGVETKSGTTIGLGVRGFVGCEYFVAAKISVGAEYGWGLGLSSSGNGSTTTQQVNSGGTAMEDNVSETAGSSAFGIGADINGGNNLGTASLVATFHF